MIDVAPDNAMHPVLPLHIETAFANQDLSVWDSQSGANYHYEFNMVFRGWNHYLAVGVSPNPHGGVGFLHYRNLLSNYGRYGGRNELGRVVEPWMFGATGVKPSQTSFEPYFTVDYMDLHILKGDCGIGLHRHRDNSEIFFMMDGEAMMVVGDWAKQPQRERCLEARSMQSGEMAMLRGGNFHGLLNMMDNDISLFMFGGYDSRLACRLLAPAIEDRGRRNRLPHGPPTSVVRRRF